MAFKLPELPFSMDALVPVMSRETLEYHYGKHHAAYVNKLNQLTEGTEHANKSLEDLIKTLKSGDIFNNAAQVWNHTFFWHCMKPKGSQLGGRVKDAIEKKWGSVDAFKKEFQTAGLTQFGSGWAWLVKQADGTLAIQKTANADNPMVHGNKPLLTCDVWEHAYYIDYRNDRAKFISSVFDVVNWDFVDQQF